MGLEWGGKTRWGDAASTGRARVPGVGIAWIANSAGDLMSTAWPLPSATQSRVRLLGDHPTLRAERTTVSVRVRSGRRYAT
jgi:hypothetical protein